MHVMDGEFGLVRMMLREVHAWDWFIVLEKESVKTR
jgi:hypothetical protein